MNIASEVIMSEVILYIAASLDGFIAGNGGDISWLEKYQGEKEDYGYADFYSTVGASIMGARTYEQALSLNGGIDKNMPTWVITHRSLKLVSHPKITLYSGSLPSLIDSIRRKTRKNIWLVGGGQLAQSFFKDELIYRVILSTVPVILGEGIPLFGNVNKEINLSLMGARSYESGIVQTDYIVNRTR